MTEEPLIYTSKGNVPIASLEYHHEWEDGPSVLLFKEWWTDASGEVVKNNAHGWAKQGLVIGGEQAQM